MSLVKVWTDVGKKRPVPLIAKIIEKDGPIITIRYLSEGKDKIWKYEEDTYEIEDDSISEYLNTDDEINIGFKKLDEGFIHEKDNSDDEYLPEEDEESDEEESDDDLEDSDETDDEEMDEFELDDEDEDDDDEDNFVDE